MFESVILPFVPRDAVPDETPLPVEALMASKTEHEWAVYMVGRSFDVLNVTATKGCILPITFTVMSYDPETGTSTVHAHDVEHHRIGGIATDGLIAALCLGNIQESMQAPVDWGRDGELWGV